MVAHTLVILCFLSSNQRGLHLEFVILVLMICKAATQVSRDHNIPISALESTECIEISAILQIPIFAIPLPHPSSL
jgi:hypothetical protein